MPRKRVYLDFNAHHPVVPEARAALLEALDEGVANPSSVHVEGQRARRLLERARAKVAALVGSAPDRVLFTSGGTEANAAALWGLVAAEGVPQGRRLVVSAVEHPSVMAAARGLERLGASVRVVGVDGNGVIDLDDLAASLAPQTTVAVQLANSETGVVQPLETVVELCRRAGAAVHCDAVQAAGKVDLRAADLGVATLAVAGHKFGGVLGAGALVTGAGVELTPLIPGSQEGHRRGGTESLPAIVAMGAAADVAIVRLADWDAVREQRDWLEAEVTGGGPGWVVYGMGTPRLPNTSCLGVPTAATGGAVVAALDLDGFAVSSGSACSSGVERASPVVEAMGYGREAAQRSLRITLGRGTGREACRALAGALHEIVRREAGGLP